MSREIEVTVESKEPTVSKGNKQKTFPVHIDTPIEDVVNSDKEGKKLEFDVDRFKKLSDRVVSFLSDRNKVIYRSAYQEFCELQEGEYKPSAVKIQPVSMDPLARMEVHNKDPHYEYAFMRADEKNAWIRDGKEVVTIHNDNVITASSDNGEGIHKIGTTGDTELILMREPRQQWMARIKKVEEDSRRQNEGAIDKGRSDIGRTGVKTFIPEKEKRGE